ncbi:MAG: CpaD family pilus assembly protein [Bradyrhizobium sp.]|uniref:CpaD family pilus assembly protein n=1 Tax=Bradyrhizobium sp. TaxID=376 RepID=UPI001DFFE9A1|nr:CpaD family pilus assembly protein [Bradyrhizobium sp.]MBV9561073.1 CpaD family pilus assembly protein [Bradyrhizobium sp.]
MFKVHCRRVSPFLLVAFAGVALAACAPSTDAIVTGDVPSDYRLRHPIAITEAERSIVIFVGRQRSGLTGPEHGDLVGFARNWVREGTGPVIVDVPVDTPNARAAAATSPEVRAALEAGGVPARAIAMRRYRPGDDRTLATIRLSYPRIAATAGPCGVWPDDLGPSLANPVHDENKPYFNLGCATQRNLAAMIDNPSDLVQPRAETPAYTMRRTAGFDRYRKGDPTTTTYPEADKAKLTMTGQ